MQGIQFEFASIPSMGGSGGMMIQPSGWMTGGNPTEVVNSIPQYFSKETARFGAAAMITLLPGARAVGAAFFGSQLKTDFESGDIGPGTYDTTTRTFTPSEND